MENTFYAYADRNASSEINWAEVGKNFNTMLQEELRVRQEKKDAIDAASREYANELAKQPSGDFKSLNAWYLDYANDASQALLMQDRLLKNGSLKVKDYLVNRQNLYDGTTQMNDVVKSINEKAKVHMERYKNDTAQETEAWLMEQIEGLSNFRNTKAYINPTDFTLSIAPMVEKVIDGKTVRTISDNKNDYMTINQLAVRLDTQLDKFKYNEAVNAQMANLPKNTFDNISRVAGAYRLMSVTSVLDQTNLGKMTDSDKKEIDTYLSWEDNTIKSMLANKTDALSLLTDAIDKVPGTEDFYTPTFSEEEAKKNKKFILLKDNGTGMIEPVLSKEQENACTDFLRNQMRAKIEKGTKINVVSEPERPTPQKRTAADIAYGNMVDKSANVGNMLSKLYQGTNAEVKAGTDYINSLPGVEYVNRDENGVTIRKTNGTEKTFTWRPEGGDGVITRDDFIGGVVNFVFQPDELDINEVRKNADKTEGKEFNPTAKSTATTDKPSEKDAIDYLKSKFTFNVPKPLKDYKDSEDTFIDDIKGVIGGYGFTAEGDGSPSDEVVIYTVGKDGKKGEEVKRINLDDVTNVDNEVNDLKRIVFQKYYDEQYTSKKPEEKFMINKAGYDRRKSIEPTSTPPNQTTPQTQTQTQNNKKGLELNPEKKKK